MNASTLLARITMALTLGAASNVAAEITPELAERLRPIIEEGLASLKEKPVALFWGDKDWCFTPNFRKRFEREFPTAEVHAWQDCGHYVVEDAHERILPLLRTFFDRHAGLPEVSMPGLSTIQGHA